mmetsp:Transcript_16/g.36  ORF Transcript_16/g.36 Transcript_16/m.36 type:complete len:156 (-) Transcript_16:8-475(-)
MSSSSSSSSSSSIVKVEELIGIVGSSADFKPGQKYSTPSPGNGDRVFYETLLAQRSDSKMAQEWCLSYGILDWHKAQDLNKIVCKRLGKPVPANSAPPPSVVNSNENVKTSSTKSNSAKAAPPKKKRKAADDDEIIADTGFEDSGVWEGQGSSGI